MKNGKPWRVGLSGQPFVMQKWSKRLIRLGCYCYEDCVAHNPPAKGGGLPGMLLFLATFGGLLM